MEILIIHPSRDHCYFVAKLKQGNIQFNSIYSLFNCVRLKIILTVFSANTEKYKYARKGSEYRPCK